MSSHTCSHLSVIVPAGGKSLPQPQTKRCARNQICKVKLNYIVDKEDPEEIEKHNGKDGYISKKELDRKMDIAVKGVTDKYNEAINKREVYVAKQKSLHFPF